MGRFDVGMSEGRIEPPTTGSREPRRLDLTGVEACNEQDAIAKLKATWFARYGDHPESPLVGISWRY